MQSPSHTGFYTTTFMLAMTVLALTVSLALLAAAWYMVSHLLMPPVVMPTSFVG